MERHVQPKSRPKVEISGLAPTSTKVSDLPNEKTVKGRLKHVEEGEDWTQRADRFPPALMEQMGRAANDEASSYPFRHMLNEYLETEYPDKFGSGERVFFGEALLVNPGKRQTSAIFENPTNPNFQETENWTSPGVGDDFSEPLESRGDVFPGDDNPDNFNLQLVLKNINQIFGTLDAALGREESTCSLNSPLLHKIREESPEHDPTEFLQESDACEQTAEENGPKPPPYLNSDASNSLQIGFSDPLERSSTGSQQEQLLEADESKSTFVTAFSSCTLQDSVRPAQAAQVPLPLKMFLSLTRIREKSVEVRKSKSDSDLKGLPKCGETRFSQQRETLLENPKDSYEKILPLDTNKVTKSSGGGIPTLPPDRENESPSWSPTLPDLTEIYESILKESKKMRRKRKDSACQCFSTNLIAFLKNKLKEKRLRMDLVDFTQNFRDSFRPKYWKPGKVMDSSHDLTEYVATFQEILHSNLSVTQIASLNNVLSDFRYLNESTDRLLQGTDSKFIEEGSLNEETNEFKQPTLQEIVPQEEIQKINLTPPTELETVLQSFKSGNLKDSEDKNKLLATVELCGSQVLVSSLTYFNNEKTLSLWQEDQGKSELIIENLTSRETDEGKRKKSVGIGKPRTTFTEYKENSELCRSGARQRNEVPEFLYDQVQLRVQHPLEAILECSELNAEEKQKLEIIQEDEVTVAIKDALKEALAGKIYLKDLFHELGRSEDGTEKTFNCVGSCGDRPEKKLGPLTPKKKQEGSVRSMFDLKKSPFAKSPKFPNSTYFCYPSVMSLQNRGSAKKNIKVKSRYLSSRTTTTSNLKPKQTNAPKRPPNKWDPIKKQPKVDPVTKRQAAATPPATAPAKAPPAQTSRVPETVSECSIELLLSDVSGSDFASASRSHDVTPANQSEKSPILLHSSKSAADGMSFRSEIIHSDSFLKYCTPIVVTQNNLNSLFKSNSDVKFYPGRKSESSEDTDPFITFVLTPRQKETAGLPENMVRVVQKNKNSEPLAAPKEEEKPKEDSLEAVEKFIEELATLRKAAVQRQKDNKKKVPPKIVKFDTKNKSPGQSNECGKSTERKVYHECQKRKLKEKESSQGSTLKLGGGAKPKENPKKELGVDNSEQVLDSVVGKMCLVFSNLFRTKYLEMQEEDKRDKMEDKATEVNRSECNIETVVTDTKEKKEDYQEVSSLPNELLEEIKTAVAGVEGLHGKDKIIEAIEVAVKKGLRKVEAAATEYSEEVVCPPNTPKKSKTVKIRIRCKGLKRGKKEETNLGDGEDKRRRQYPTRETSLLDSLVSRETVGNALSRKTSTYFDALEKVLDNEDGGAAGKMAGDGRSLGHSEAVPISESSGKLKLNFSLTKSDERLLSAVSFERETEEVIYKKISKYLEEGKVSYSMTLLDGFLKKTENSLDDVDSRARLKNLLLLVENKSKNLIRDLERNAWMKVLSLLEEASLVLEDEDVQHSKKAKLLEKIQSLNIRRLVDMQNGCFSFENIRLDDGPSCVLGKLRESLTLLKRKVDRERQRGALAEWEEEAQSSESAIRIHSAEGFPEMCENLGSPNARSLKNKLQQQKVRLEKLVNSKADNPAKLEDLKNVVLMKMKSLENVMDRYLGESSKAAPYNPVETCRKEGKASRDGLGRRTGYVDLVRYFMKAWDARMSLSSLSNSRV